MKVNLMEANRQQWNDHLKALRALLESGQDHQQAVADCLRLHAQTHQASLGQPGLWSFQDEVLEGLNQQALRFIPRNEEHSAAWIIWHIARCEDITMNLLIAGSAQVLMEGGWASRIGGGIVHTGNAMSIEDIQAFSDTVNLDELLAYRSAVGQRTRQIIAQLPPGDAAKRVDSERMKLVSSQGALLPEAVEVYDYWASRTFGGLLLMPATRHNFVHLNELLRMKSKLMKIQPAG